MTDHRDVIAAFVDNEPVGAGELSEALASADGREYLIDVLVLRGLVGSGPLVHGRAALRSDGATGLPPSQTLRRTAVAWAEAGQSRARDRARWLTAAAALVAVSLTAGYFAGRGLTNGLTNGSTTESPASAQRQAVEPAGSSTRPAPAPTHVIRMEKGVDWNERSGGN